MNDHRWFEALNANGVVCALRKSAVIGMAPMPTNGYIRLIFESGLAEVIAYPGTIQEFWAEHFAERFDALQEVSAGAEEDLLQA